jgi:hypothetical protein
MAGGAKKAESLAARCEAPARSAGHCVARQFAGRFRGNAVKGTGLSTLPRKRLSAASGVEDGVGELDRMPLVNHRPMPDFGDPHLPRSRIEHRGHVVDRHL